VGALPVKKTSVKLVQSANANPAMLVTLPGIVTLVRLVQPWNAYFPMLVTLPEIMTLVMPKHS